MISTMPFSEDQRCLMILEHKFACYCLIIDQHFSTCSCFNIYIQFYQQRRSNFGLFNITGPVWPVCGTREGSSQLCIYSWAITSIKAVLQPPISCYEVGVELQISLTWSNPYSVYISCFWLVLAYAVEPIHNSMQTWASLQEGSWRQMPILLLQDRQAPPEHTLKRLLRASDGVKILSVPYAWSMQMILCSLHAHIECAGSASCRAGEHQQLGYAQFAELCWRKLNS